MLSESSYLNLYGESNRVKTETARFSLHALDGVLTFAYSGASPELMSAWTKRGVDLVFLIPHGRLLARTVGEEHGSFLLRQTQYRASDSPYESLRSAKDFILGKIYNTRRVLKRATRGHPMLVPSGDRNAPLPQ